MNLRKPRRRGFFISVPSRLGAGAQFHFLDSEFQTFATNLGDTADSPRTEGRRDSLIRERYVIEGRPLQTSLEKILRADEGGTSPRAGPVSAAAVILKPGTRITGIDESKSWMRIRGRLSRSRSRKKRRHGLSRLSKLRR